MLLDSFHEIVWVMVLPKDLRLAAMISTVGKDFDSNEAQMLSSKNKLTDFRTCVYALQAAPVK